MSICQLLMHSAATPLIKEPFEHLIVSGFVDRARPRRDQCRLSEDLRDVGQLSVGDVTE